MKIIVSSSHQESSNKAAINIANQILTKKDSVLGFATGSSPVLMYKNLIEYYKLGLLSFENITAFNLDEYVGIDKNHKNSYYYFMRENLFDHIDIDQSKCYIENGLADDMQKECDIYEELINKSGGIDVQILGIGTNGHIGFNEPSDTISSKTHIVELTQSTIDSNSKYFTDIDMPTKAVTMGIATILKSKKIILLASGKSKAKAIYETVYGAITPKVPSSLLQLHPDVTLYIDDDAASMLNL